MTNDKAFYAWLESVGAAPADSTAIYQEMASQSGESLAGVYVSFDSTNKAHWRDAGIVQDFLWSTNALGGKLLDFGPGDGWPSLPLAQYVETVVGVDASERRAKVCRENAKRMGIANAEFVSYKPNEPLPFPDAHFDAITAASSIEQTPDITATLRELYRVLKPGGAIRIFYESLSRYSGQERDVWAQDAPHGANALVYLRDIAAGRVFHAYLRFNAPLEDVRRAMGVTSVRGLPYSAFTGKGLSNAKSLLKDARVYTLHHPDAAGWIHLLRAAGFSPKATHDGGTLAEAMFASMPEDERGRLTENEVIWRLADIAPWVVTLESPRPDALITATR